MTTPFGLLFDLDGTITDSDPAHLAAYRNLLRHDGRDLTEEDFQSYVSGKAWPDVMRHFFPSLDEKERALVHDRKEQLFIDHISTLTSLPGLISFIERASALGTLIGVVTNAPRATAEKVLEQFGLSEQIDVLVIGMELEKSKPDPLPYQVALDLLGLQPQNVLAFEDSVTGITSATRAGLVTVGLRTSLDDEVLRSVGAHVTIEHYDDPILDHLLNNIRKVD